MSSKSRFKSSLSLIAIDALFVGLCVFAIYALTVSEMAAGYESETIAQARSWVNGTTGDAAAGRAGILAVALYVPFIAIGDTLVTYNLAPEFGQVVPNFALAFTMTLTALLVLLTIAQFASRRAAVATALAYAFTTMAWPYSKMGMETALTLASALTLLGYVRIVSAGESQNARTSGWIIFAVGLASMLLTKVHAPVPIALFVAAVIWELVKKHIALPSPKTLAPAVAILTAGLIIYLIGNWIRYDRVLFSTSYSAKWEMESRGNYIVHLFGLLFSPGKSIFVYNPILVAAIPAAFCFKHRCRWIIPLLIIVVGGQIAFHAYFRTWADETWGPRRLLNLTPILILPIAVAFDQVFCPVPWIRRTVWVTLVLGLLFQLNAVASNYAAYAWTLQPHRLASEHNMVWNPETPAWRIHAKMNAARLGGPSTMNVEADWIDQDETNTHPWNRADQTPTDFSTVRPITNGTIDFHPVADHSDVWWMQRRVRYPERAWWRDKPVYLALMLALTAIFSGFMLFQRHQREPV